ncbi:hypothetical protein HMPREF1143_1781 [Peptoanaerobacter stomatis]|uniref:Uncharacterized protein n=1 Tax=Peptoanaerobacter stomatis TaxID=796937 RepID=J6HBU9_9FIRM|nr:hypothetical protein HMPREF1143_1781 [Peptoanaerobacter stomatis]
MTITHISNSCYDTIINKIYLVIYFFNCNFLKEVIFLNATVMKIVIAFLIYYLTSDLI